MFDFFTRLMATILFFPAMLVGWLVGCAVPGYEAGKEIAEEGMDED